MKQRPAPDLLPAGQNGRSQDSFALRQRSVDVDGQEREAAMMQKINEQAQQLQQLQA